MSADNRVNDNRIGDEDDADRNDASIDEPPRWWLRNPAAGVLVSALLGIATASVTASIKMPDGAPGSTVLYLVILPIALLLPAIAVGGALVAWRALGAAQGRSRLALAPAAALALVLNLAAVGLFVRWVIRILFG